MPDDPRFSCDQKCPRFSERIISPCLHGVGPIPADIMLVGEAPGQGEDRKGIPFIGQSGRLLDSLLEEAGLSRDNLFVTNCVKCATADENKPPKKKEAKLCRKYLLEEINNVKPKVICAIGATAMESLLGKTGITKFKNQVYFSDELQTKVVVIYHPAFILRNPGFMPDLRKGVALLARESSGSNVVGNTKIQTKYLIVTKPDEVAKVLSKLESLSEFAFDFETTSLNTLEAKIICMSVSWQVGLGITIPWELFQGELLERLLSLFLSDKTKIGQNVKYDVEVALANKIRIRGPFRDVMLEHSLIDENAKHGLDDLVLRYLDMGEYWSPLDDYKKKNKIPKEDGYRGIPRDILFPYAAKDADATWRLDKRFCPELTRQQLDTFFHNHTMPTMTSIIQMEFRGIKVNREKLAVLIDKYTQKKKEAEDAIRLDLAVKDFEAGKKFDLLKEVSNKYACSKTLKTRYATVEKYIEKEVPKESYQLNLNSPKQLADLFFGPANLNLESIKSTGGGNPSVDAEVLEYLAEHERVPTATVINQHRKLGKFLSTYLVGIYNKSAFDGRVHPQYQQALTTTGRLSCKEPNLQNIPREAKDLKDCFESDPGFTFVKSDLAQAEFRCWAHYSNDPDMIRDIESGMDIHRRIAAQIFGIPEQDIAKDSLERTTAKQTVFGLMYGRGPRAIAEQYGISENRACSIKQLFFSTYPYAAKWLRDRKEYVKEFKCVRNWLGRIRRLPMIDSDNQGLAAEAERQATNSPIQSLASEMNDKYMENTLRITRQKGIRCYPATTVHDANVFQVEDSKIAEFVGIMNEVVVTSFPGFRCKMKLDFEVGKTLGTLESYK